MLTTIIDLEGLEPRLYLSIIPAFVVPTHVVPGDGNGDNDVDLDDFVILKRAQPIDLLAQFAAMKINWGRWQDIDIMPNPLAAGTYITVAGPLFVDGPSANDCIQSTVLPDCWLSGAMAAIADASPETFTVSIADLGDGTFITRMFDGQRWNVIRMTTELPVNAAGGLIYAQRTPDGELWAAWLEKAAAEARYGLSSYASLAFGWPDTANRMLTGDTGVSEWVVSIADLPMHLAAALADGRAVTLVSQTADVGRIVGNHVYAVTGMIRDPSGEIVGAELYNPHGCYVSLSLPELRAAFRLVTEVEL